LCAAYDGTKTQHDGTDWALSANLSGYSRYQVAATWYHRLASLQRLYKRTTEPRLVARQDKRMYFFAPTPHGLSVSAITIAITLKSTGAEALLIHCFAVITR
jgi:hypothetical protein